MRSRAMLAIVVLSSALVSGGWLVQRGLVGGGGRYASSGDRARLFDEVYRHVSREYVDTLSDSVLYTRAAEGLVSELNDPHSSYLSPALLSRLSERTSGRYVGVGVQIDVRDGAITIVTPLPSGPAIEAGIQAGDRIVEMDGKPLHAQALEEVQKALRGEPGSVMRITIERPGVATPLKYALTRREIRTQSVQHGALLRDGVGYVALTIFSEASAPELRRTIDSLRGAGMKSLIFDLRGDPGGLLDQGVAIADLFLDPAQRIVSLRGRTSDASRVYADRAAQPWPQMPVALLVDSNSASAAEIVAGALQDHDRALLLGTTTYGKGSAQNVYPLPNGGAVKLTTARWYTPSGRSIDRKQPGDAASVGDSFPRPHFKTDNGRTVLGGGGITPDILFPVDSAPAAELAFQRALGKQIPQFRSALTDYALSLKNAHAVASADFIVTAAMRADLWRRMQARGIAVDSSVMNGAHALIDRQLGYEIARDVFGTPAEFARRLRDDPAVTRTVALLAGAATQADLLTRTTSSGPRS